MEKAKVANFLTLEHKILLLREIVSFYSCYLFAMAFRLQVCQLKQSKGVFFVNILCKT